MEKDLGIYLVMEDGKELMDKEDSLDTQGTFHQLLQQALTTYRPMEDLIVVGSDGVTKYRYIPSHNAWDKIDES